MIKSVLILFIDEGEIAGVMTPRDFNFDKEKEKNMSNKSMNKMLYLPGAILGSFLLAFNASADVNGTIDVSLTLNDGCIVNGDPSSSDVSFGSVGFGAHSALFTQADSQVLRSGGTAGIEIECSPGVVAQFSILSGLHDGDGASGVHAMKHSIENEFIGYSLFSDAARTLPVALNTPIALTESDGTPQTLELWSRAWGTGGHSTGDYSDTLTVLLEIN